MTIAADKFMHLKVFLHRNNVIDYKSNHEYLMVTPTCFGKVEILNLNVDESDIIVEFIDFTTHLVGNVRIKINDEHQVLFICWSDIKELLHDDVIMSIENSGLMEFDF